MKSPAQDETFESEWETRASSTSSKRKSIVLAIAFALVLVVTVGSVWSSPNEGSAVGMKVAVMNVAAEDAKFFAAQKGANVRAWLGNIVQNVCAKEGGLPAMITSASENAAAQAVCKATGKERCKIGLDEIPKGKRKMWFWLRQKGANMRAFPLLGYRNFASGAGSTNGPFGCRAISAKTGKWVKALCNKNIPVLCMKGKSASVGVMKSPGYSWVHSAQGGCGRTCPPGTGPVATKGENVCGYDGKIGANPTSSTGCFGFNLWRRKDYDCLCKASASPALTVHWVNNIGGWSAGKNCATVCSRSGLSALTREQKGKTPLYVCEACGSKKCMAGFNRGPRASRPVCAINKRLTGNTKEPTSMRCACI